MAQIRMSQPPLGLAALIKYYETHGRHLGQVEFRIFDENAEHRDVSSDVTAWHPSIVGITAMSFTKGRADVFARQLREKSAEVFIVAGGVHFQVCPTDGLENGLYDVLCTGEGEEPLRCLIDDYWFGRRETTDFETIPNLAWVEAGNIRQSARWILRDLGAAALPDYEWFDLKFYFAKRQFLPRVFGRSALLLTSRGCPFRCTFCFNSFRDGGLRKYNIHAVVDKIVDLRRKYGVRLISVSDDLFLFDRERVRVFCEEVSRKCPDIKWACQARASVIKPEDLALFQLMRRSGCIQVNFGLETGSDELLKKLKGPDASIAKNELAIDLAYRAGIPVFGYFMCGIPGETKEQMAMTEAFILKNLKKMLHFELFIYTPYPGSALAAELAEHGGLDGVTIDDLAANNLVEGRIRVFNPLVSQDEVIRFRQRMKQLIMGRYTWRDKVVWLFVNMLDNPGRTVARLRALYGPVRRRGASESNRSPAARAN